MSGPVEEEVVLQKYSPSAKGKFSILVNMKHKRSKNKKQKEGTVKVLTSFLNLSFSSRSRSPCMKIKYKENKRN